MASKRILALVQRSGNGSHTTDSTPVVVWEHELELLEEIHGVRPIVLDDYEVLVDSSVKVGVDNVPRVEGGRVVEIQKVRVTRDELVARRVRELGLGVTFDGDPAAEYDRLVTVYGMHREVRMPVVEKVYGSLKGGRFIETVGVANLEDLSMHEVRTKCKALGIPFGPKDTKEALIANIRALEEAGLAKAA